VKKTVSNFSRSRRSWDILQEEVKESSPWFPCGTLNELHGHKWTTKPSMCALDAVKKLKKKASTQLQNDCRGNDELLLQLAGGGFIFLSLFRCWRIFPRNGVSWFLILILLSLSVCSPSTVCVTDSNPRTWKECYVLCTLESQKRREIYARTLHVETVLALLVLCHLVKCMLLAVLAFTKGLLGLGNIHHDEEGGRPKVRVRTHTHPGLMSSTIGQKGATK
jgi:hypothetical protein